MTAPRATRLIRVPSLGALRHALIARTAGLDVFAARRCAIIVPTHAAAEHLRRTLESARLGSAAAVVVPHLLTRQDWLTWLFQHLASVRTLLSPYERHVVLGAAARDAHEHRTPAPFGLRPALIDEMLAFYDTCRRQLRTVDDFERLACTRFERDAEEDRGAARLLTQTRFMVAAFRGYERRIADLGRTDEHALRARLIDSAATPLRHVIVTVGDRASDPFGLWPADFDLLARLAGLASIDVLATTGALAAGWLQRLRDHLPGIIDADPEPPETHAPRPVLAAPETEGPRRVHVHRDREDELSWVAREIKRARRSGPAPALARTAIVFKRPLPYVYLAGQIFPSAGIPHETFEAMPLASEPYAAAVDLVLECVNTSFSRAAIVALLRSPHFHFECRGQRIGRLAVSILDRELSEARYRGDPTELARLARAWIATADAHREDGGARHAQLARAGEAAAMLPAELAGLLGNQPPSVHLDTLATFIEEHQRVPVVDEPVRQRHLRARSTVVAAVSGLRDACRNFDDLPRPLAETTASLHRWIECQTFSPHRGAGGVVVTDAHAARYGDFDAVFLVGLTQRDWPESRGRCIFFPGSMLKDLGWPEEADARTAERAAFRDLLGLAGSRVMVSTFTLEDDAIVEPSPFLEDLTDAALTVEHVPSEADTRVSAQDAISGDPVRLDAVSGDAAVWLALRQSRSPASDACYHGQAGPAQPSAYKVSALDRFHACPFVFFATEVLQLKEEPEDDEGLTPRAQGRLVHEVLESFFSAWQAAGGGAVGPDNLDAARRLFADVAEARLAVMPEGDAAIERGRLLGSVVAPGVGDIALGIEAERPAVIVERLLEFSLKGEAEFRTEAGTRRVSLRATADRIDLLADGTFRVLDYKLSKPPDKSVALQLPAYAAAARARLAERDGRTWTPSDLAYVAFGKAPNYAPLAEPGDLADALAAGEARVVAAVDRIERGDFPPQPRKKQDCRFCAFASVCRKDYVDGE